MHPWQLKFNQCAPSIAEASKILHVKFNLEHAMEMNNNADWKGLEQMLLDMAGALRKRNSRHAKSLATLVWALWEVFPFKTVK